MVIRNYHMYQIHREYILEGQEGKNFKKARRFLETKGFNYEESMAIFGPLKQQIPNLRKNDSKFTLGVVRILFEQNLLTKEGVSDTAGDTLGEIDGILGAIERNNEVIKFDEDLNGYTLDDLKKQFGEKISQADAQSRNELENQYSSNNNGNYNGYTIVRIKSFDEASKSDYSNYCDWCVTQDVKYFNQYTDYGKSVFYFCLKDGYKNTPKEDGVNSPLDEYGLSMIAVCVDKDGCLKTCTCRWNHENGGSDKVMDEKDLSSLINANFYSVFKPKTDEEQNFGNKNPIWRDEFKPDFEYYEKLDEFCIPIKDKYGNTKFYGYETEEGGKVIIVHTDGSLLINDIFDDIAERIDVFIPVQKGNKINFINPNCGKDGGGCLVSDVWFDNYKMIFKNIRSLYPNKNISVYLYGKVNLLTQEGSFVFDQFCTPITLEKTTSDSLNKQLCVYDDNGLFYLYDIRDEKLLFDEPFTNIESLGERCLLLTLKDGKRTELYDIYHNREQTNKIVDILDGRGTSTNGKQIVEILNKTDGKKYWMDGSLKLYDHETKEPLIPKRNESITHHKATNRITEKIFSKLKQL